jgi:transcriptional regulator with XRE-family HTH domain
VNPFTLLNWERGKVLPKVRHLPRVYDFLGYCPWVAACHRGDVLRQTREAAGLTQEQFGALAGATPPP